MQSPHRIAIRTVMLVLSSALASYAGAQTPDNPPPHHRPPPEALAACKALSSGQECSFTSPHGAVSGTCWAPEGKPLACRPKHPPEQGGAPPPKQ